MPRDKGTEGNVASATKPTTTSASKTKAQLTAELKALQEKTAADIAAIQPASSRVDTSTLAGIAAASRPTATTPTTATTTVTPKTSSTPSTPTTPVTSTTPTTATAATGSGIDFNAAMNSLSATIAAQNTATTAAINQLYAQNASMLASQQAAAKQQQTNWINAGKELLTQYGLSSLGNKFIDLITNQGFDNQTAMIKLQSEPEWKARFSANESRLKEGLPVLSPADYLNTEAAYKDVMIAAGIDPSVYSDVNYLGDLIAKDVSPAEVQQRVTAARTIVDSQDPLLIQQLNEYGLNKGDIILHLLDPKVASNVIATRVQAAEIGAEAARYGMVAGTDYATQLASMGVTQSEARAGYRNIAAQQPGMQELATRFAAAGPASQVGQELQAATFGTTGAVQAQQNIARAIAQETALFQGSSGIGKGSLGTAAAEAAGGIS